jgi:hypothetical protein
VACAQSLPCRSVILASAVAALRPKLSTLPSQRIRPVAMVTGRNAAVSGAPPERSASRLASGRSWQLRVQARPHRRASGLFRRRGLTATSKDDDRQRGAGGGG